LPQSPYEIYSNDIGDDRGFHILDTENMNLTPINNPYKMYEVIDYEDDNHQTFDSRSFEGKIVKLIVRKKTDAKKYEKFVDKLLSSNIAELKLVESIAETNIEIEDYDPESEDTISILSKYIEESDAAINKQEIKKIIHQVYKEACELV